jgi:hypothetical protein
MKSLKHMVSDVDDTIELYSTKLRELKEELSIRLGLVTGQTAMRTEVKVMHVLKQVKLVLDKLEQIGACN